MLYNYKFCLIYFISLLFWHGTAFGDEEECFNEGNISILNIKPSFSTILDGFNTYTFVVTVEYRFNNLDNGVIGIRCFETSSWENLDNQVQNDLNVSSQAGVETVYVTARTSYNNSMVDNIGLSVLLIDKVFENSCTAVSDELFFTVDNTNIPEKGDVNNDNVIDLKDLVTSLKIIGGDKNIVSDERADIDNDYKIGIENALYILDVLKNESDYPETQLR